jgi:NTP pyrophosphatase (non-canonical NTP hydrolase)
MKDEEGFVEHPLSSIVSPKETRIRFINTFQTLAMDAHQTAVDKGFYPPEGRNFGELMMLIVSEISECFEAFRKGNPPDDKLPQFDSISVELADAIIRIMDTADAQGLKVAEAVIAKMEYNKTRPHKHGKLC